MKQYIHIWVKNLFPDNLIYTITAPERQLRLHLFLFPRLILCFLPHLFTSLSCLRMFWVLSLCVVTVNWFPLCSPHHPIVFFVSCLLDFSPSKPVLWSASSVVPQSAFVCIISVLVPQCFSAIKQLQAEKTAVYMWICVLMLWTHKLWSFWRSGSSPLCLL